MFIACWVIGLLLFLAGSMGAIAASGSGSDTKSGSGALLFIGIVLIGIGVFGAPDTHGQCDTTGRCSNTAGYHQINPLGD